MDALLQWCSKLVEPVAGRSLGLCAVAGDASFRRYYRLAGCEPTRIAVFAPPDRERNLEFTRIAALLRAAQALAGARVFVPRASFPTPDEDEFYWVDLIGLAVVNRAVGVRPPAASVVIAAS